jgi:sugar lactone lactonase YvrE
MRPSWKITAAIGFLSLLPARGAEPDAAPSKPARRAIVLPDNCNTPDAMAVLKDGSIILSVPNFTDPNSPGVLMKIARDDAVSLFCKLPLHPDTKHVFPMGVRQAPSGDLYVADCQFMDDKPGNSRLLCVRVVDSRADKVEVVADGLEIANGVAIRDGYVYVTDSATGKTDAKETVSSIFRFRLDERNVHIKSGGGDPHLVATMTTKCQEIPVGADGIDFDEAGNLYVANCGDGLIEKLVLSRSGAVERREVITPPGLLKSADGIFYDQASRRIHVADILANAIRTVDLQGHVETVAQDGDNDGSAGQLDGPSEAVVRGDEVIAANFDRVFPGCVNTKSEPPFTLSVIRRPPPQKSK